MAYGKSGPSGQRRTKPKGKKGGRVNYGGAVASQDSNIHSDGRAQAKEYLKTPVSIKN